MLIYKKLSDNIFECSSCPTPCDGISKGIYDFITDSSFSEAHENKIIEAINQKTEYTAKKSSDCIYPDIEVSHPDKKTFYIEVKVQRRAFMQVEKLLPQENLKPSNTLALNKSDLLRYFKISEEKNVRIFILWVLLDRPCVTNLNGCSYFYLEQSQLQKIYFSSKNKRTFIRKSGTGDIINGEHKGVIVNYHFAINELKHWKMPV